MLLDRIQWSGWFRKVLSRASLTGLACCFAAASMPHLARASIIYTGVPIQETFDSLPTSTQNNVFPNDGTPTALATTGWVGAKVGSTASTPNTNAMNLVSANNTVSAISTGSVVSAGGPAANVNGNSERALGTYFSTAHSPAIGVEIINQSGAPLTEVTISFIQENWQLPRDGSGGPAAVNTIPAIYGTTASGLAAANFLTATTGISNESLLNLVSPAPVANADDARRDGNLAENQVLRSATIDFSADPIEVGESFFLRFVDVDEAGSDAIMAIDSFNFTAVPEPASICLLLVGFVGAGWRLKVRSGR